MSVDDMAKDLQNKLGKGPAMSVELGKPKEVGKLEKLRAKGVLKRPAAMTPVKIKTAADAEGISRHPPNEQRSWRFQGWTVSACVP